MKCREAGSAWGGARMPMKLVLSNWFYGTWNCCSRKFTVMISDVKKCKNVWRTREFQVRNYSCLKLVHTFFVCLLSHPGLFQHILHRHKLLFPYCNSKVIYFVSSAVWRLCPRLANMRPSRKVFAALRRLNSFSNVIWQTWYSRFYIRGSSLVV